MRGVHGDLDPAHRDRDAGADLEELEAERSGGGETHFETVDVALVPDAAARARSGLLGAEGVIFRRTPPGMDRGWHHPPRRQLVVSLAGTSEVTASDGEVRRFGPGSVLLAEDVEPGSPGHRTRGLGDGWRLTLFVPLGAGEPFPPPAPASGDD